MGRKPDGFRADYPIEWCPVYYDRVDRLGIGFDRSSTGTGAVRQYRDLIVRCMIISRLARKGIFSGFTTYPGLIG
jgi:alpha-glucuronidase